ncbi:MAG: DUF2017 family protein [Actinobacteria bacterium]|nr:DUF2017 family protein [Actinomycetota bacterium]
MSTRPFEARSDRFRVRLQPAQREMLGRVIVQLREVLEHEDPSSDPAVARLFPATYPDDPLASLEYETAVGPELLRERLDAIRTMESTLRARTLAEEELLAWLATLNGLRLVLGIRLDITEETTEDDFTDEESRTTYGLYAFLTWLESSIVDVLPVG